MQSTRQLACRFALIGAVLLAACGGGGSDSTGSGVPPTTPTDNNPGPAGPSAFMLPYRIGTDVVPSRLPHIAIDAAGGVHAVYAANAPDASGRRPAYYAYCASDCNGTGRFATVTLSDGLGDAQIQLTSTGQPRILLAAQPVSTSTIQHEYWSCDGNCTQAANWAGAAVVVAGTPFFPSSSESTQSFTLDAHGRPRFIYQSKAVGSGVDWSGTYLASCDSGCSTGAAQWRVAQLDENEWKNAALTIDAQGLPRIAYSVIERVEPYLPVFNYLECATRDCSAGVSRIALGVTTTAGTMSSATFSMRLTMNGAPRIALYTGSGEGGSLIPNQLLYLSCNASCAERFDAWGALNLGLPTGYGEEGVALVLDRQDRPRIALHAPVPVDELAYAWCDAQCDTSAHGWQHKLLPSAKAAEAEMGLPARMGCPECIPPIPPCPNATWLGGLWPALTLDAGGNPLIGFEVQLQAGGGACSVGVMARVPRLMSFVQPR